MKVNKKAEAVFSFSSEDYFLVHNNKSDNEFYWSLNPRIDMSYKGKDDQCGMPVIYLEDEEAEELKQAGFSIIEMS